MIFDFLFRFFSNDMGIDLGTATTLVYVKWQGIVLCEPSVVAVRQGTNRVLAVGNRAKEMLGRTPGDIVATRPLKDGVIADFEITQSMLRYFIMQVHNRRALVHPRIIIAVPYGITEVEKRAVVDSAEQAGARDVYLIEEPMAAAIGAGLPVQEPGGNMVVDVGGGTTEVAVISLAGIVVCKTLRVAGDEMDEAIIQHMKRKYNIAIGERTAEAVKIRIGSVYPLEEEMTMEVKGRDLSTGLPRTVEVSSEEIREALMEPVKMIIDVVHQTLEETPPELSADLIERGIVLTGGGSLLRGLDKLIADKTGLPVRLDDDPITTVVRGTGKVLDEIENLASVLAHSRV